jgi:AcrR family transcriptional regulator
MNVPLQTRQNDRNARPARTAHGEAQHKALVNAAYQLIAEGGFERLRTRDIAARAGVNVATLHYYFDTKEDLIRGVVDRVHEELSSIHAPSLEGDARPPLDELRREFADVQHQMAESPGTIVVLFELGLRALRDPAIHRMVNELETGWQNRVEAYLAAGVRQGVFRRDLDVPAAAAGVVVTVKGCMMQLAVYRRAFPLDRVAAEVERWLTGAPQSSSPALSPSDR